MKGRLVRRRIDEALAVAQAGLLQIEVDILDGAHHARRLMGQPARVGVGHEDLAGFQARGDGADAGDVEIGVAADLDLEMVMALGAADGDALDHALGRVLRDRAIAFDRLALAAAQQGRDRHAAAEAKDVPAGDVERRLHVGMALEVLVHDAVDDAELARILAEQMRRQLGQPGAHAVGVGRQIGRAQRTDLAVADQAVIGVDAHDRGVVDADRLAARPAVGALAQRQVDLVDRDLGDLH